MFYKYKILYFYWQFSFLFLIWFSFTLIFSLWELLHFRRFFNSFILPRSCNVYKYHNNNQEYQVSAIMSVQGYSQIIRLCPNLRNLSRGLNLEKIIKFLVEPTIFEPRLKFRTQLKFFKFGLCKDNPKYKNVTILRLIVGFIGCIQLSILMVY